MRTTIFYFLSIVFIISCNKEESTNTIYFGDRTKVEGRVLEYGTNKPIPNTMIILREGTYVGIWPLNGSYESLDTVYSDQSGKYSIEFRHKVTERPGKEDGISYLYEMDCNQDKYFGERGVPVGAGYWYKKKDIILDPYAWIKVHIKNVNPYDEKDHLFTSSNGGGGSYDGKIIDANELHRDGGNRKVELFWRITKNKIKTEHFDSLYLPAFDTIPYEILY